MAAGRPDSLIVRAPIAVLALVLVAACSANSLPPAATSTAAPSQIAPASIGPSTAPGGPSLSPEPTSSPKPTPSPGPARSPEPSPSPSARGLEVLFTDDFSDPKSGFPTGDFADQRVAYLAHGLLLEIRTADRSTVTLRPLGTDWPQVRLQAMLQARRKDGTAGYAGLVCAQDTTDYYAAVVGSADDYVIVRVSQGVPNILQRGPLPTQVSTATAQHKLVLDCSAARSVTGAASPAPGATVSLSVDEVPVASVTDVPGFSGIRRAGFEAESTAGSKGYTAVAHDLTVWVDTAPAGPPGPGASFDPSLAELLLRIPAAIRATCTPGSSSDVHLLSTLSCTPATGVDAATYELFDAATAMDAGFNASTAPHTDEMTGTDCAKGPSAGPYEIDGQAVGRVACYLADGAALIEWTDERLAVRALGRRNDGSFADLSAWWSGAGPLP